MQLACSFPAQFCTANSDDLNDQQNLNMSDYLVPHVHKVHGLLILASLISTLVLPDEDNHNYCSETLQKTVLKH